MRCVLPGGATLTESKRRGDEQRVACRRPAAVQERTRPIGTWTRLLRAIKKRIQGIDPKQLETIKLILEIGVALLALIGGIIALVWGSR
jgi:hypothetical protein